MPPDTAATLRRAECDTACAVVAGDTAVVQPWWQAVLPWWQAVLPWWQAVLPWWQAVLGIEAGDAGSSQLGVGIWGRWSGACKQSPSETLF